MPTVFFQFFIQNLHFILGMFNANGFIHRFLLYILSHPYGIMNLPVNYLLPIHCS